MRTRTFGMAAMVSGMALALIFMVPGAGLADDVSLDMRQPGQSAGQENTDDLSQDMRQAGQSAGQENTDDLSQDMRQAGQSAAQEVEEGAEATGEFLEETGKDAAQGTREAFRETGEFFEDVARETNETIQEARTALDEMLNRTGEKRIPADLIKNAKGIAIFPNLTKAGLILGGRYGDGLLMLNNNGKWQGPLFISLYGASIGAQLGIENSDLIMVFNNREALDGLEDGELTLGAEASAAAGTWGSKAGATTQADILVYKQAEGLFAGASISGGYIDVDKTANRAFYRDSETTGRGYYGVKDMLEGKNVSKDKKKNVSRNDQIKEIEMILVEYKMVPGAGMDDDVSQDMRQAGKSVGQEVKEGAEATGEFLKETGKDAAQGTREAFRETGDFFEDVAIETNETIQEARTALDEMLNRTGEKKIPADLIKNAKGIAIFPNLTKAGLILGGRYGDGLLMVNNNGKWQGPLFISLYGASIGAQLGIVKSDLIMIFNNRDALTGLEDGELTLGAEASAAAGTWGSKAGATTQADILVYKQAEGLFAGASISSGYIDVDKTTNRGFYRDSETTGRGYYSVKEMLEGKNVSQNDPIKEIELILIEYK